MSIRAGSLVLGAAAVLASLSLVASDAHACGGCFHPPESDSTVVTGHRMALSVSTDRTVLWDQVEYAGDPEEFAWVLPIKPGATLDLAADEFFEALDAATTTNVVPPSIYCPWDEYEDYGGGSNSGCNGGCLSVQEEYAGAGSGGGSGNDGTPPVDPVTVVHHETIGPYESVTIHSNVPGALYTWLADHNYAVDQPIEPVIDAYESEGFDFIALRLIPGANVKQMQPVRVTSPGASPVLPLRMVAAGTGANVAITLFVIGEGRWEAQNFENNLVDTAKMSWDFTLSTSDYGERRQAALAELGGETWLTTYAYPGALLSRPYMPAYPGGDVTYFTATEATATSILELYAKQASENGAEVDLSCVEAAGAYAASNAKVVDPCVAGGAGGGGAGGGGAGGAGAGGAGGGGECMGAIGPDEIDARELHCGPLDDVGVALTGLHPSSVWITRLEANLPQAALAQDMSLQAEATQAELHNWVSATEVVNPPCADWESGVVPVRGTPRQPPPPGGNHRDLMVFGAVLAALASAFARRHARPAPVRAALAR